MLTLNEYVVKEHVGLFKMSDAYDIIDPANGTKVGLAQERVPGLVQVLRFLVNKQLLPTKVVFIDKPDEKGEGKVVLSIKRGFSFLFPKIHILANDETPIGYFKKKLFSLGGSFYIHDMQGARIGMVKGDWKGWNFRILDEGGKELGVVTKQWAGLGKELFTTADTYVISIAKDAQSSPGTKSLLLAAGIAIDTIFKEN